MKLSTRLATLAGFAAVVGLIALNGVSEIGEAMMSAGWGILLVIALHVPQMVFSSLGWREALPFAGKPGALGFLYLRQIREAVNALLPVAQIGGEVVGARLLVLRGVPMGGAAASVTVDLTLEMLGQVIFTLLGLGLLVAGRQDPELVSWIVRGVLIAIAALVAFMLAQRFGLFRLLEKGLLRLAEMNRWKGMEDIAGLHDAVVSIYRSPRRLILGTACHLMSWLLGGLEVMAALHVLGEPVSLRDALIIEALGQAFHSLGFAVPGALGVQEGGLILVCGLLGIGPQSAIELSLLKRVREIALGIPGLLAWQWTERRHRLEKNESRSSRDALPEETS